MKKPRFLLYVFLILSSLLMIVPFLWMISSALKSNRDIIALKPSFFPSNPHWHNFIAAWTSGDFLGYFYNTAFVSVWTTVLTLLICSMAGYIFAKFEFKGKKLLFILFIGTMMIPEQVTMIPVFYMNEKLGILNTLWSVILPLSANAFGVFLMRQFIVTLPNDLIEAARIDGTSEFGIFWKIILPLTKPALASLGILTFLNAWNEFLLPLIMINSPNLMTLQVSLTQFQGEFETQWNLMMAASTLSIIPIILVFFLFERYLVEGISMTGLKG